MGVPIHVVDDQGNSYMVDPDLLLDANAPVDVGMLQPTIDNQIYQLADDHQWYRVLRADRVSWMTDIKPNVGNRAPRPLAFVLGRAIGYT